MSSSQLSEPKESDPLTNPWDWTSRRKWINVGLISFQAALTPIATTVLAVGNISIAETYNLTDPITPNLPVALFLLGNGLGPLFLAPMSEIYGRRIIYLGGFSVFSVLSAGCALSPNIACLSAFRLFAGMAGSVASTLGSASVGDMFPPKDRGRAQAVYGFMPLLGPVFGGILGSFIIAGTGTWRWTMWVMAISSAMCVAACIAFLRETYAPHLRREQSKRSGKISEGDSLDLGNIFARAISRPLRLLILSPVCTVMSVYSGFAYGVFYFHIVTLSLLFSSQNAEDLFSYHWHNELTGLSYLGVGIGSVIGVFVTAKFANGLYLRFVKKIEQKRSDGEQAASSIQSRSATHPEARLPFLMIAVSIAPIGLTIYAWTTEFQVHWIVPLSGAAIFAIGVVMAHIYIQTYMVDTFGRFAASAIASCSLLRSLFSCVLSIVGVDAYEHLGYGWGTMLLAFILIAMQPIPVILYIYGPKLRMVGPNL